MRALICGAGVGGLSAGIALQRAGFDVVVLERAPDLRVSGFGLNLWPNAGRALNSLGLQSAYEAISVPLRRYWTLASTGDVIYKRDVADWPERFGAPATVAGFGAICLLGSLIYFWRAVPWARSVKSAEVKV